MEVHHQAMTELLLWELFSTQNGKLKQKSNLPNEHFFQKIFSFLSEM